MAISAVNLQYLGAPGVNAAQGQIIAANDSGILGQQLYGIGTAVLDGAATTFTLNWIDGVQKLFTRQVVTSVLSVTAPATIGGVANQAVYSGVGSYGQYRVGQTVTFAGFSNSANNGAFTITALTTSSIQVTNASSVAETNPQATAAVNSGSAIPVVANVGGNVRCLVSANNVLDTAAAATTAIMSAVSATGCTVTISAAGSAAQTLSVFVQLTPVA